MGVVRIISTDLEDVVYLADGFACFSAYHNDCDGKVYAIGTGG